MPLALRSGVIQNMADTLLPAAPALLLEVAFVLIFLFFIYF